MRLTCGLANVTHMTTVFESMNTAGRVPTFASLGLRLMVARETAGMSQTALAEAIDSSRATVSNYEREAVKPRRVTLRL